MQLVTLFRVYGSACGEAHFFKHAEAVKHAERFENLEAHQRASVSVVQIEVAESADELLPTMRDLLGLYKDNPIDLTGG